ncbi:MAG TPA: membrane dipeptidase [Arenimonas sp.]|nr:membrane dipeptidase [Arenimonas sp.]
MNQFMALTFASLLLSHQSLATDKAKQLAQDAIIVDTHIDAPTELLVQWNDLGYATPNREFDYPSARSGGLDVAFMSIYTSPEEDAQGKAQQVAHMQIDSVEALIARNPDKFALMTSPKQIDHLMQDSHVLLALGMENGAPFEDDITQVGKFFDRGVRYVTLAHSASNRISDSSYDPNHQWNGLSPFGEKVVAEMNRLGMIIDVSHLSDKAVEDVLQLSKVPVIASHSAFRHFTPGFERNISDELALAVAAKGGVVHIVFGSAFVNPQAAKNLQAYFDANAALMKRNQKAQAEGKELEDQAAFAKAYWANHPIPETQLNAVLDQYDYAIKLIGIDHVGIGSDFDGVSGNLPIGLKNAADYPNLIAGLQARGYTDEQLKKLLGGNLLRAWTAIEAGAVK